MLIDFILCIIGAIVFYKYIDKIWRVDAIKEYTIESMSQGSYSEEYKSAYSHHLKGKCNLVTISFFIIIVCDIFTKPVISMMIGFVSIVIMGPIIGRYYPKPKEDL